MTPQQRLRACLHHGDVQRASLPQHVGPSQRVSGPRVVGDSVHVPSSHRREAGVEAVRCRGRAVHDDVRRQQAGEPRDQRLLRAAVGPAAHRFPEGGIDVDVRDLPSSVHPGIGPTGDGQPWRREPGALRPEHDLESVLDRALNGA